MGATVLAAGKEVGPRRPRRARPKRACAWLRAAPPLPSAVRRSGQMGRDEGRPDPSTPGPRPGSNKGLTGKRAERDRRSLPCAPSPSMDQEATGRPPETAHDGVGGSPLRPEAGAGGRTRRCITACGAAESGGQGSHNAPDPAVVAGHCGPLEWAGAAGREPATEHRDNPPLSGDLVCKRPFRFQSGTEMSIIRDGIATKLRQMLHGID